jgi:hypothetical protein
MVIVLRVYDREVSSRILRPERNTGWRMVIIGCCKICIMNFIIFGIQSHIIIEIKVGLNEMDWACNISLICKHKLKLG